MNYSGILNTEKISRIYHQKICSVYVDFWIQVYMLNSPVPIGEPCFDLDVMSFSFYSSPSTFTLYLLPLHPLSIHFRALPLMSDMCSDSRIIEISKQFNVFEKSSIHMTILFYVALTLFIMLGVIQ